MEGKIDIHTQIRIINSKIIKIISGVYIQLLSKKYRTFFYKNKKMKLWLNSSLIGESINCKLTERSVELAIARMWIELHKTDLIEIGAVTPYYFPRVIKDIVDPTDNNKLVTQHKSIFEINLENKNVISISTVEHIGTGDYGLKEELNSINAIEKIMKESKHYLITYPIGYNELLDDWTKKHFRERYVTVLSSGRLDNNWIIRKDIGVFKTKYRYIDYCGTAIAVLEA